MSSTFKLSMFWILVFIAYASTSFSQTINNDWPMWQGPNGNFTAYTGKKLITDLNKAQLIWESEDSIPVGAGQSRRYGCWGRCDYVLPAGGGGSIIYYDSLLYIAFFRPSGTVFDSLEYKKRAPKNWRPNFWYTSADDVVRCVNPKTGQTVWERSYYDKGLNWTEHKGGPGGLTPVAFNGKVFSVGTTLRVYCTDAKTGMPIWESLAIPRNKSLENTKQDLLAKWLAMGSTGRDLSENLLVADQTLIVSDYERGKIDPGLIGINPENGEKLWHVPDCHGVDATPSRWTYDGKEYIVVANTKGQLRGIEPKTGRIMWENPTAGYNHHTITTYDNYVFVNMGQGGISASPKAKGSRIGCYKMTPNGADMIWALDTAYSYPYNTLGLIPYKGYLYVRCNTKKNIVVVKIETGEIVKELTWPQIGDNESHSFAVDGRLILEPESQHSKLYMSMFTTDSSAIKQLNDNYSPPFSPQTTSYAVPFAHPYVNGRIYWRSAYKIYCYDLTVKAKDTTKTNPNTSIINLADNPEEVRIYPIPATDKLYVSAAGLAPTLNIIAINTLGVTYEIRLTNNEADISTLPTGVYLININNKGKLIRGRFVKK